MVTEQQIINALTNSGLDIVRISPDFIYIKDPSCILPTFDTFLEYAWLAILVMFAFMILGWAVLYIKNGIKATTAFNNFKTLILVLGILACVKPIVNIVYGKDLFAKGCDVIQISRDKVEELYEIRNMKMGNKSDEYLLYETFNVTDSASIDF